MSKANNLTDFLKDIADGIREKKGTTDKINPQDFRKEIDNLSGSFSVDDLLSKKISGTITLPNSIGVKPAGIAQSAWDTYPDMHGVYPYLFFGCTQLTTVINNSKQSFVLGEQCFRATGITSFDFKNVTRIGDHAFHSTLSLKTLENLDSVSYIGVGAFNSSGLTGTLTLPASLKTLNSGAFSFNYNVTTIIFKGKPTVLNSNAFSYMNNLTDIYVPWAEGEVKYAPWGATNAEVHYSYIPENNEGTVGIEYTTSKDINYQTVSGIDRTLYSDPVIVIASEVDGKPVTIIGVAAFSRDEIVTSVTIPDSVTTISQNAFIYCTNLASVTIGNGVASIGNFAFAYTALTTVTIPDSVSTIGAQAFYECDNLTSVTLGAGITSIVATAFGNCDNLTDIYVPWASGAVTGAPWGAKNAKVHYNS